MQLAIHRICDTLTAGVNKILERFRITSTVNSRNDHVTMFVLHLKPRSLFSVSRHLKLSSFELASKDRIILRYFHRCTYYYFFFQESVNANLTFFVYRKQDSKFPYFPYKEREKL